MALFGVIHETDVSFFSWRPLRNGRKNWPPLPEPTRCLSEACLLLSQSRKSRKCWERNLYLAALPWLALAEKWNPDPLRSLRARTSFPVLHSIQDWVILFTKQNITSNYSRPVFYSLLPRVGFIAVCKCQDTYKDAQYKWYFPNYAHMFGFTWVAAERNVVPDAPGGGPPH